MNQESIKQEERHAAADAFIAKMTEKTLSKPAAKVTEVAKPTKPQQKGVQQVGATAQKDAKISTQNGASNEPSAVLENLVILLEPNAARYELHDVDNRVLAGFLAHKLNILMFNYHGFEGGSTEQPSLKHTKQCFKLLLRAVLAKFRVRKLIIYGKSIGGYFAVERAENADLLILDRSFSNLS